MTRDEIISEWEAGFRYECSRVKIGHWPQLFWVCLWGCWWYGRAWLLLLWYHWPELIRDPQWDVLGGVREQGRGRRRARRGAKAPGFGREGH